MRLFKSKKILAIAVIFAIVCTLIAPLTSELFANAETYSAIAELKSAWQSLNKEERELWMISKSGSYSTETNTEVLAIMGIDAEKLGSTCIKRKFTSSSGQAMWELADGKAYSDITKYTKIGFYFTAVNNDGTPLGVDFNKKFKLQINSTSGNDLFLTPKESGAFEVIIDSDTTLQNGTSAKVFFEGEKSITGIKVLPNECKSQTFMAGGIFGYSIKNYPIPENTEGWGAAEWIEAAEKLDITASDEDDIERFTKALTALRKFTDSGKAYNKLVNSLIDCGVTLPKGYVTMDMLELLEFAQNIDRTGIDADKLAALDSAMSAINAFKEQMAISALKTAWQKLSRDERELWLQPLSTSDYVVDTSDAILNTMDATRDLIGATCIKFDFTKDGQVMWEPAKGKTYDDIKKYNKIGFYFTVLKADGSPLPAGFQGTLDLQINSRYLTHKIPTTKARTEWYLTPSSKLGATEAKEFFEGNIKIDNIKIMRGLCNNTLFFAGGIYGYYNRNYTLPENHKDWGAKEWIFAAEALDIEGCDSEAIKEFTEALTALREFTESGKAYNNVLEKLSVLEKQHRVVVAIPKSTVSNVTTDEIADKMGLTKEQIGDKYLYCDLSLDYNGALYTDLNGGNNIGTFDKYDYIEIYFKGLNSDGTAAPAGDSNKFNFQINAVSNHYIVQYNSNYTICKFQPSNATTNKYFNGTSVDSIKIMKDGTVTTILAGSAFGIYTGGVNLPEDYATMTLGELLEFIENEDLEGYDTQKLAELENAITDAEPYKNQINPFKVEEAKDKLIEAWKALNGKKVELYAIPSIARRKATTPEIAKRLNLTEEQIGPYYLEMKLKGAEEFYTTVNNDEKYPSLAGYDSLSFYFLGLNAEGKAVYDTNFTLQFWNKGTDGDWHNSWPGLFSTNAKQVVFSTEGSMKEYFTGEKNVGYIKLMPGDKTPETFIMTSVFATKILKADLPFDYKTMSLPTLFKFAQSLNTSDYSEASVSNFKRVILEVGELAESLTASVEEELKSAWTALGKSLPADGVDLIEAGAKLDLSDVTDKALLNNFLDKYMALKDISVDGHYINNLVDLWRATGLELPKNYYKMSPMEWISAVNNIKTAGLDANKVAELKQLKDTFYDYITFGKADATELRSLVTKSAQMNPNDFTTESWETFKEAIAEAQKLLDNLSRSSQLTVDKAIDSVMSAWSGLRYYVRSNFVDFGDYYLGDPDLKCVIRQNTGNESDEVHKDILVDNDFTTAVSFVNAEIDTRFCFQLKELPSVKESEYLEFYVKVDKNFVFNHKNVPVHIQFREKSGMSWADAQFSLNVNYTDGNWHRIQIPINKIKVTSNKGKHLGYLSEIDYKSVVIEMNIVNGGKGTFTMSSISKVTTKGVKAGTVPNVPKLDYVKPVVIVPDPPVNPFKGLDRGDPWGDLERLNKKPEAEKVDKNNDTDKNEQNEGKLAQLLKDNWIIITVASVVFAALVVVVILIIIKRKKTRI